MTNNKEFRPSEESDAYKLAGLYIRRAREFYVGRAIQEAKPAKEEERAELTENLDYIFASMLFDLAASIQTGSGMPPAQVREARAIHAAFKSGVTSDARMIEDIEPNIRGMIDRTPATKEICQRISRGLVNIFALRPDNQPRHVVLRHLKLLSEGKHPAFSGFGADLLPNLAHM